MKRKNSVIAAIAVAVALLASLGVAVAAGTSGGTGRCPRVGVAEEALGLACRNAGEGDRIRAEHCEGMEERECPGDCERVCERVCERLRDRACYGEGAKERNRAGEGAVNAGEPGGKAAQGGECPGVSVAEEALGLACRNAGEGDRIRAEHCEGMEERECPGDCERVCERVCERLRDRACYGEGAKERNRAGE